MKRIGTRNENKVDKYTCEYVVVILNRDFRRKPKSIMALISNVISQIISYG